MTTHDRTAARVQRAIASHRAAVAVRDAADADEEAAYYWMQAVRRWPDDRAHALELARLARTFASDARAIRAEAARLARQCATPDPDYRQEGK